MILIFETVSKVLEEDFNKQSDEFKKGALTTLHLFRHGIKTHGQYNNEIVIKELRSEIESLKKELSKKQHKINMISYHAESLIQDDTPLDKNALNTRIRTKIRMIIVSKLSDQEKINRLNQLTSNW